LIFGHQQIQSQIDEQCVAIQCFSITVSHIKHTVQGVVVRSFSTPQLRKINTSIATDRNENWKNLSVFFPCAFILFFFFFKEKEKITKGKIVMVIVFLATNLLLKPFFFRKRFFLFYKFNNKKKSLCNSVEQNDTCYEKKPYSLL
jgi:hypothetical protein